KMAEIQAHRQRSSVITTPNVSQAKLAKGDILQELRDILQGKISRDPLVFSPVLHAADFGDCADEQTRNVYDTLMASQLILAWTAFETVAEDLWVAAVNSHPAEL